MKTTPLLIALLVAAGLYVLVFERQTLAAMVGGSETTDTPQTETPEASEVASIEFGDPVRVVVLRSTAQTVENAVVLRGRTEAAREVQVAAETSGRVISEPLRKGTFVEEGDILCVLDPGIRDASLAEARARLAEAMGRVPEAEASVAEAEARIREAQINVNNARRLSRDGFASETQLISAEAVAEAATARLSSARAAIASAQAGIGAAEASVAAAIREIERLTIRAPFAGLLETDTAELGTLMQPGAPCATVIQLDPIKLVGYVPELDVDKIQVGAMAGARLTSGRELQGIVSFLSRSGDDLTRTFRLEVEVPNEDLSIRDGQTADILVAAEGQIAHLLPQSALTLNDEGALGVRTIDAENTVQFQPIELIRDSVDGVWVTGLPETSDIIVVGQEFVVAGVIVEPTYQTGDSE